MRFMRLLITTDTKISAFRVQGFGELKLKLFRPRIPKPSTSFTL